MGAIQYKQTLLLAHQVASAMANVHKHKTVHLDFKPAQILLKSHDGGLLAKISDFGLSKPLNSDFVGFRGTPEYCAPEMFATTHQTATPALDNFALGLTLLELFHGDQANLLKGSLESRVIRADVVGCQNPTNHQAWLNLSKQIINNLNPRKGINQVIQHLLDVNPATRWTAQQAADALQILIVAGPEKLEKRS